jgi:AcrR family transcriptional regulator
VTRPPYAVAARELLRDSILDATHAVLRERPWAEISLAEIAKAAGVSRQTIYNEFGSRRAVAEAYVLREGERFLTGVEAALAAHPEDPRGALAAAFAEFLESAGEHPLLRAIVAGEGGDELLGVVTSHDSPVVAFATERLASFLTDGWPRLRAEDAGLLAEQLVRLGISYAALPAGPVEESAAGVARALGPFLDELWTASQRAGTAAA